MILLMWGVFSVIHWDIGREGRGGALRVFLTTSCVTCETTCATHGSGGIKSENSWKKWEIEEIIMKKLRLLCGRGGGTVESCFKTDNRRRWRTVIFSRKILLLRKYSHKRKENSNYWTQFSITTELRVQAGDFERLNKNFRNPTIFDNQCTSFQKIDFTLNNRNFGNLKQWKLISEAYKSEQLKGKSFEYSARKNCEVYILWIFKYKTVNNWALNSRW